jgi:hypothetical protein
MNLILFLSIFCMAYVAATDSNPENRQNIFGFGGGFGFVFGQGNNVLPCTQGCNSAEIYSWTTTTTSYRTWTVTCSQSTAVVCGSGRRRRGILLDGKYEEQFPLSPTAVQG